MTNLTKQEIQAARKFITEREYECDYGYYNQPISETLNEHFDPIKQALDIAEKYVWLPISEAPKDGEEIVAWFQQNGEFGRKVVVSWRPDLCTNYPWFGYDNSFADDKITQYLPTPAIG